MYSARAEAMAKKVTASNLASVIGEILSDYGDETKKDVSDVIKSVAKKGAQAVKNESLQTFKPSNLSNGRYGTGWTYTVEEKRLGTTAIIYNSKYPGLPHLLENGHAKRGGGRTAPKVHIAPVEDELARSINTMLGKKQ